MSASEREQTVPVVLTLKQLCLGAEVNGSCRCCLRCMMDMSADAILPYVDLG